MLTLLLANWRLIAAGVVVAAVALMGWRVTAWYEGYRELPKVKAALRAEQECSAESKCQEREQILRKRASDEQEKIRKEYEQKLADIANRPPLGPVRLCRPRGQGNVRVPPATTGASTSPGTELSVEVGRDIEVELSKWADDADTEALKLRLLWQRDVALSTVPEEKKNDAR
ncbi:conserved hypothetical protein [Gammaproteobacteria bacterium]